MKTELTAGTKKDLEFLIVECGKMGVIYNLKTWKENEQWKAKFSIAK